MRLTHALAPALSALLAFSGCSGHELIVKPLDGEQEGRVYFRALQSGEGDDLSKSSREAEIGEMPTEWELPESLYGGKGQARVVYGDGTERLVEFFHIQKDKDTIIRVSKPQAAPKSRQ